MDGFLLAKALGRVLVLPPLWCMCTACSIGSALTSPGPHVPLMLTSPGPHVINAWQVHARSVLDNPQPLLDRLAGRDAAAPSSARPHAYITACRHAYACMCMHACSQVEMPQPFVCPLDHSFDIPSMVQYGLEWREHSFFDNPQAPLPTCSNPNLNPSPRPGPYPHPHRSPSPSPLTFHPHPHPQPHPPSHLISHVHRSPSLSPLDPAGPGRPASECRQCASRQCGGGGHTHG